ncbi:MAG: hypothetical protein PHF84_02445 [bacterium]|nr:hypothetical protein [bacterium]
MKLIIKNLLSFPSFLTFKAFIAFIAFTTFLEAQPMTNYGVHGSFSNIPKRLLIRQGTISSADTVNSRSNAVPVGDGTYYFRLDLVQGADYNFIFQSRVNNSWQYEQIPNKGSFPSSVDNKGGVTSKKGGTIIKTGDDKTRRKITVPVSGTNYYVFCNYGHHPNPPAVEALPRENRIVLKIKSRGRWGYPEPDVEYGGWFSIYRSTIDQGPYAFITNIRADQGNYVYFTNTGLLNETDYYYVVTANDSYAGTNATLRRGPFDREVSLPDYDTYLDQENIDANMYSGYSAQGSGIPHQAIKVIFKVEHIDWDTVREKDHLVWLTPVEEDGRFYANKIPGRIIYAKTR